MTLSTELERLSAAATPILLAEIIPDLNNIVRAIEDEGDRVYLGSTNDAERLCEIADWIERHLRDFPFPAALRAQETPLPADVVELVGNLRSGEHLWQSTRDEIADLIERQARQLVGITIDRDLWKKSESTCSDQYDKLRAQTAERDAEIVRLRKELTVAHDYTR